MFQALTQSHQIHKRVSAIGVRQEESLLEESATREAELLGNISELEAELRSTRQTLDQFRTESERANTLATELANQVLKCVRKKFIACVAFRVNYSQPNS